MTQGRSTKHLKRCSTTQYRLCAHVTIRSASMLPTLARGRRSLGADARSGPTHARPMLARPTLAQPMLARPTHARLTFAQLMLARLTLKPVQPSCLPPYSLGRPTLIRHPPRARPPRTRPPRTKSPRMEQSGAMHALSWCLACAAWAQSESAGGFGRVAPTGSTANGQSWFDGSHLSSVGTSSRGLVDARKQCEWTPRSGVRGKSHSHRA
jgi:hypothetical protein